MISLPYDIAQLSISERIQLVEDIWDSLVIAPEQLPVSETQQEELDRRMEAYGDNSERGISWQELQARIKSRP